MKNLRNWISTLLTLSIFLASDGRMLLTAKAQNTIGNVQNVLSSPNPREDDAFFKDKIDKFRIQVLPLLEKNPEDATEIFFEQVLSLYDIVGKPFKWRHADFYAFVMEWESHGVVWPSNHIIRGLPNDNEITEEEAIGIAQRTVLLFSGTSNEDLDNCWPSTSFHRTSPTGNFLWKIDFVVETPEKEAPYYIKYMLTIDPVTGIVYNYFDSRSNSF